MLLTTQYLEEADVLSDNIIVIDKGTVIAEGTADQLKASAGGSFCEIVPVDPPRCSLPSRRRSATWFRRKFARRSTRTEGRRTGSRSRHPTAPRRSPRLFAASNTLDVELADIALRRPSLDDVFLRLTGHTATPVPGEAPADGSAGERPEGAVAGELP